MRKQSIFTSALALLALLFIAAPASAQYDDVYYNPDDFATTSYSDDYSNSSDGYDDDAYTSYDDDGYNYDDNAYDYQYSSRIRRFQRPYAGFGYYDPIYANAGYY
ncbi:MAG: hypothetical protein ACJAX1_003118, partial [Neolewinella sp.]